MQQDRDDSMQQLQPYTNADVEGITQSSIVHAIISCRLAYNSVLDFWQCTFLYFYCACM